MCHFETDLRSRTSLPWRIPTAPKQIVSGLSYLIFFRYSFTSEKFRWRRTFIRVEFYSLDTLNALLNLDLMYFPIMKKTQFFQLPSLGNRGTPKCQVSNHFYSGEWWKTLRYQGSFIRQKTHTFLRRYCFIFRLKAELTLLN